MSDDIPSDPPPVEPMSDVAWARVERGLMARLDSQVSAVAEPPRSQRRWVWLAVPAFAAAAAVALVLSLRGTTETHQTVPPVADTTEPRPELEPSRVVSGDAPTAVSFGDSHLALDVKTAIVMNREGGSPSVLVERGAVTLTVAPRANRPPFIVRAGDTVVRVVGTQFRVARYEEHVTVAVEHGIVDVQFRGNTVRVGANQTWRSEQPEAVTATAMLEPPVAPAKVDEPEVPATPVAKAEKPVKTAKVAQPAKAEPAVGEAPLPVTQIDRDRISYERMQSLEVKAPKDAIEGYLKLSGGSGKWAEVSLYSAARLATDRGDPRAKTFLAIYLRRFPNGANVSDARKLLQRLEGEPR